LDALRWICALSLAPVLIVGSTSAPYIFFHFHLNRGEQLGVQA
jgi:hypothetical protein